MVKDSLEGQRPELLLYLTNGLLWDIVAHYFGLFGLSVADYMEP